LQPKACPIAAAQGAAAGRLHELAHVIDSAILAEHRERGEAGERKDHVNGVPSRPRRRRFPGNPSDQDIHRFSSALVAPDQSLREFGVGRHRLVQPAYRRVPIPEGAEDFDQPVKCRARIRYRHSVRDPGEAASSRDLIEHGRE